MNTEAVVRPISSTASDTSHCILQESGYPVGKNERSIIVVHKCDTIAVFL